MNGGYWTIGHWRGTPIRLHWSAPLGALFFARFQLRPAFFLGFLLLILLHELGHAAVVRACRQRVLSIDIHGLGGLCRWTGSVTRIERAMIAWGGVWAQALLLLVALLYAQLFSVDAQYKADLLAVFIDTNLWVMMLNLLPTPPLDGAEAWPLLPLLWRRLRLRFTPPPPPAPPRTRPAAPPEPTPARPPEEQAAIEATFQKVLDGVVDPSAGDAPERKRPEVEPKD